LGGPTYTGDFLDQPAPGGAVRCETAHKLLPDDKVKTECFSPKPPATQKSRGLFFPADIRCKKMKKATPQTHRGNASEHLKDTPGWSASSRDFAQKSPSRRHRAGCAGILPANCKEEAGVLPNAHSDRPRASSFFSPYLQTRIGISFAMLKLQTRQRQIPEVLSIEQVHESSEAITKLKCRVSSGRV